MNNCKNRRYRCWSGYNYCLDYEMGNCDAKDTNCPNYEPETETDEHDCPSATAGDYSPSNPWDAPGMSVKDFI